MSYFPWDDERTYDPHTPKLIMAGGGQMLHRTISEEDETTGYNVWHPSNQFPGMRIITVQEVYFGIVLTLVVTEEGHYDIYMSTDLVNNTLVHSHATEIYGIFPIDMGHAVFMAADGCWFTHRSGLVWEQLYSRASYTQNGIKFTERKPIEHGGGISLIAVQCVVEGTDTQLSISTEDYLVTINSATDSDGNATSTQAEIVEAINGNILITGNSLITAELVGSGPEIFGPMLHAHLAGATPINALAATRVVAAGDPDEQSFRTLVAYANDRKIYAMEYPGGDWEAAYTTGVKASHTHNGVKFLAKKPVYGADGISSIAVQCVVEGTDTPLSISTEDYLVTINSATDSDGNATSTQAEIVEAVNAGSSLIEAELDDGGSGIFGVLPHTHLTGAITAAGPWYPAIDGSGVGLLSGHGNVLSVSLDGITWRERLRMDGVIRSITISDRSSTPKFLIAVEQPNSDGTCKLYWSDDMGDSIRPDINRLSPDITVESVYRTGTNMRETIFAVSGKTTGGEAVHNIIRLAGD